MRNLLTMSCAAALILSSSLVQAQNLLLSGDFEPESAGVPGWTLEEFYTGQSGTVNSGNVNVATTAQSGDRHLFLPAFNSGSGTDDLEMPFPFVAPINAELSQIVDVTAGNSYNFSGYSRFEANFSGGVDTIANDPEANTPFEGGPSPTKMELIVEFLNGSGNVVGTPAVFDVKADRFRAICDEDPFCNDPSEVSDINDNNYYQHTLSNVIAPTGATQARVKAAANDMLWNIDPAQSAFYDTFSFHETSTPGTELLANADLEEAPPTGLENWDVVNVDPGNPTNESVIRGGASFAFANRPESGGTAGVWLSSFFGEPEAKVDGSISQAVDAIVGEEYKFSGWSRREANFAADSMVMELAFLDDSEQVIGTPVTLDVIGFGNDNDWYEHELTSTAPAGAAQVRVTAGMTGGVDGGANPQSAFYDDFVLEIVGGNPADLNNDGFVDGLDLGILLGNFEQNASPGGGELNGTDPVDGLDLGILLGAWSPPALSAASVPEPMSAVMLLSGLALVTGTRRRRS